MIDLYLLAVSTQVGGNQLFWEICVYRIAVLIAHSGESYEIIILNVSRSLQTK